MCQSVPMQTCVCVRVRVCVCVCVRVRVHVLPALPSPGAVGGDDHLPAVVRVGVVNVQLQALALVGLDQREQVLGLTWGGDRRTPREN